MKLGYLQDTSLVVIVHRQDILVYYYCLPMGVCCVSWTTDSTQAREGRASKGRWAIIDRVQAPRYSSIQQEVLFHQVACLAQELHPSIATAVKVPNSTATH